MFAGLLDCEQDCTKTTKWIFTKLSESIMCGSGKNPLKFGADPGIISITFMKRQEHFHSFPEE